MAKATKSDNHDPAAKLALRRHFLSRYHADGSAQVLDCCQGSGLLWTELRQEFTIRSYWGLDKKAQKGRLKLDSARVLAQKGWVQDVIDIDTYGSPFAHWLAMLPNVMKPITVFLTVGHSGPKLVRLSRVELVAMGITLPHVHEMPGLTYRLVDFAVQCMLGKCFSYRLRPVEAVEVESDGNARYLGVRLEPA